MSNPSENFHFHNFSQRTIEKMDNITDKTISDHLDDCLEIYQAAISFQNWRVHITVPIANNYLKVMQSDAALAFFFSQSGLYRSSMITLRTLLEESLMFFYYHYHPLHYKRWLKDDFKIYLRDIYPILLDHYEIKELDKKINLIVNIKKEYGKLSKYVHLHSFYSISDDSGLSLMQFSKLNFISFKKSFIKTVEIINLILILMFSDEFKQFPITSKEIIQGSISDEKEEILLKILNDDELFSQ